MKYANTIYPKGKACNALAKARGEDYDSVMSHKKTVRIDPLTQALPMGGVDSHAHLDDKVFDEDRALCLARAQQAGISHVGNIFLDPQEFSVRRHLFDAHPEVFFIVGIHPCDAHKCTDAALLALKEACLSDARVRAIGEIGLDYYWKDCPREIQLDVLGQQLDLARELQKPVVIHCREAEADCLTLLESRGFANYPLLWHCFGGAPEMAKRLIHNGWHISIPGPVTYKANSALREALAVIPEDRLLFETDCPYLSPEPWRGTRNEPAYTVFTVRRMAEELGRSPEKLWQTCGDNARRFFGLD